MDSKTSVEGTSTQQGDKSQQPTTMFGIEFAPRSIPVERRLQTFAVLFYTFLFVAAPILSCLIFLIFLFSPLYILAITYLLWIIYDFRIRQSPSRGGSHRRWEAVRRGRIWKYYAEFFPVHLVKTCDLDPEKNYLFGYHPHGIIGCGAFANFATEATDFSKVFPGITPHLLTLKANFLYPVLRGLLLWNGCCDVSKESIQFILTRQGVGNVAVVVVGGAEEALEARPGCYNLTLKRRKGFVKIAIRTGASLVPVYCFGENDLFFQADNPTGSKIRSFQEKFKQIFGFSPPLFHGRGVFNYSFGLLPFRKPIYTVVGRPISVVKNPDPDDNVIDEIHQTYMQELSKLFDEHKIKYGVNPETSLHFI